MTHNHTHRGDDVHPVEAAMRDDGGWQPIATAPKDGNSVIDLWVMPHNGKSRRRVDMWWLDSKKWQGWRGGQCHVGRDGYPVGDFVGSSSKVTHWMPLPAAPTEGE